MQRVFPPSAGGKPENLQSSKPHNGKKEKKKRGHLAFGQTCLGSFGLLGIKAIRSIIHSSICHIAVSLTPKPPGERLRDRRTSVVKKEAAEISSHSRPLCPHSLCVCLWTFFISHIELFQRHLWNLVRNFPRCLEQNFVLLEKRRNFN